MKTCIQVKRFFVIVLFVLPQVLMARGAVDREDSYPAELNARFQQMVQAVGEESMTSIQAMEQLRLFQQSRNRFDQEEIQLMETYMKGVENGTMTQVQACKAVEEKLQSRHQIRIENEDQNQKTRLQLQTQEQLETQEQLKAEEQAREKKNEAGGKGKGES